LRDFSRSVWDVVMDEIEPIPVPMAHPIMVVSCSEGIREAEVRASEDEERAN
jgi:hypothetical protein